MTAVFTHPRAHGAMVSGCPPHLHVAADFPIVPGLTAKPFNAAPLNALHEAIDEFQRRHGIPNATVWQGPIQHGG